MSGASSWSFREEDATKISVLLDVLLRDAGARTALLVDRTGQMLATVGEEPRFDPVALTRSPRGFSATTSCSHVGENEFGALFTGGKGFPLPGGLARRVICGAVRQPDHPCWSSSGSGTW